MRFLLPVVIVAPPCAPQSARGVPPGLGSIEGRVVDASSGEPIAKATVIAEPDDPPAAGKLAHTLADDGGKFFLDLAPGSYVIAGSNQQDFYPNVDNAALAVDPSLCPQVFCPQVFCP